jgi:hypothetical protein
MSFFSVHSLRRSVDGGGMNMAHKDGSNYYMKVALVENGEVTPRRFQRLEWQDHNGRIHFLEGKDLPADLILHTGTGQKEKYFARFLGVKVPKEPTWEALLPTKANLVYVLVGAALVLILNGVLTLATL